MSFPSQVFLLANCEDNGLYLRTLATGTELHQLKGHKSKVSETQFGEVLKFDLKLEERFV